MKQFYFLITLLFCPILLTHAQSDFRAGFVVNNTGDTLRGFIKYNGERQNAQHCQFKPANSDQVQDFTPADIRYYTFEGDRQYESRKIHTNLEDKPYFLELIVQGKVSLYLFRDNLEKANYYIEKINALPLTELKITEVKKDNQTFEHKAYISTLAYALKEANFPESRIKAPVLDRKPLTKLITEYNQKVSPEKLAIVNETPKKNKKIIVKPGFFVGLNNSTYIFTHKPTFLADNRFGPSTALSFSVFTNFYFFYWRYAFVSVQPEITYTKSQVMVMYRDDDQQHAIPHNLHYLKIPLIFKCNLRNTTAKVNPYINAGAFYAFQLSPITQRKRQTLYSWVDPYYDIVREKPRYPFSFVGSIGSDVKINTKHTISLEARFEIQPAQRIYYRTNSWEWSIVDSKIHTTSIRLGYRF